MVHFLDFLEEHYQGKEPVLKEVRQAYIRYIRINFNDAMAMNWIEANPPEVLRETVHKRFHTYGGSDCNPLYEYVSIPKNKEYKN